MTRLLITLRMPDEVVGVGTAESGHWGKAVTWSGKTLSLALFFERNNALPVRAEIDLADEGGDKTLRTHEETLGF